MGYPDIQDISRTSIRQVDAQCGSPRCWLCIAWHRMALGAVVWFSGTSFKARQAARKCGRRKLGTLSASPALSENGVAEF